MGRDWGAFTDDDIRREIERAGEAEGGRGGADEAPTWGDEDVAQGRRILATRSAFANGKIGGVQDQAEFERLLGAKEKEMAQQRANQEAFNRVMRGGSAADPRKAAVTPPEGGIFGVDPAAGRARYRNADGRSMTWDQMARKDEAEERARTAAREAQAADAKLARHLDPKGVAWAGLSAGTRERIEAALARRERGEARLSDERMEASKAQAAATTLEAQLANRRELADINSQSRLATEAARTERKLIGEEGLNQRAARAEEGKNQRAAAANLTKERVARLAGEGADARERRRQEWQARERELDRAQRERLAADAARVKRETSTERVNGMLTAAGKDSLARFAQGIFSTYGDAGYQKLLDLGFKPEDFFAAFGMQK